MHVLLTGATGFLGSHLVRSLLKKGHKVSIFKRSTSNCVRITDLLPLLKQYDLDKDCISSPFLEQAVDTIIHCATCYGRDNENSSKIIDANVIFPLKLLETATVFKTKKFINTDTFSHSIIGDLLPRYNLTKKQFLDWGKLISDCKEISFINMRLEHLYGPGDSDKKFVSNVINSCLNNVPELLLTSGQQKRDFIYIDDAVSAFLSVLNAKHFSSFSEYQLGTGKETSIQDFVQTVHDITKSKTQLKFGALAYPKNEIMTSKANNQTLKDLGWRNRIDLDDGIRAIIKQTNKY